MTRTENLDLLQNLNVLKYQARNNDEKLKVAKLYYLHQIVEAVLSENIASIPTTVA